MSQHPELQPPLPARYRPRPSGISMGDVVDAFEARDLDDPSVRRWLLGETLDDDARTAAAAVIARGLVMAGVRLAPSVGAFELDEADVLRDVILHHVEAWEALRDGIDREGLAVLAEDGPWLAFAFLRLAAIDLALRGAAAGTLARARDPGRVWSPPRGFDELMARARVALELAERSADERSELGDVLEAGFLRLLEQAEHELASATAPGRAALLELVRRGTRASAARGLVERLRRAEVDPLWVADLRAACEPWSERLVACARRLAGEPDPELPLRPIEQQQALRAEVPWLSQADHLRDAPMPERRAILERPFVLPIDDHPPERARSLQRELVDADQELDGTLEHGRRALQLAPDEPAILVAMGVMLADRACERRDPGWEYHVDVGLALLRRATRLEPRWDRPWIEIAIVLADVGAWERARKWVAAIPAEVPVTARLSRLRAALLGSGPGSSRGSA